MSAATAFAVAFALVFATVLSDNTFARLGKPFRQHLGPQLSIPDKAFPSFEKVLEPKLQARTYQAA